MNHNEGATQKYCAKCMATFECLHNEHCWCMSYKISKENLEYLKKTYDNCLCPECLSAYAQA